jgi:toxin ParE1/3/4
VDYQIDLSPEAIKNLEEITTRIALDNPERAESFGNELLARIEVLRRFPRLGSVYSSIPARRKLISPPYLIIYRVFEKMKKVEIISFLHSSRWSLS